MKSVQENEAVKSVQENEANRFCFTLTLWPPHKVKVSEVV